MRGVLDRITDFFRRHPEAVKPALAALVVVAGLIGVGIVFSDDDGDGRPDRVTITVPLRGAAEAPPGADVPDKMRLGPEAQDAEQAVDESNAGGHERDVRDESPAGVPQTELDKAVKQQSDLAKSDKLPDLTPFAAPSQRGCRTRLVGNFSSRNGVRPRLFVLHYTVSPNRPGFADVDGITSFFNNPGSQASSNYVVDADGNCNYIVRETSKAWTQAAANPVSVSVEQIAVGNEPDYANAAGYRKLGRIFYDFARRWKVPLSRGKVNGAVVVKAGIVQHADFGLAGGGHHDVNPFGEKAVARVLAEARKLKCDERCRKAKVLRGRHERTHAELKSRRCAPASRTRSPRCKFLHERNRNVHAEAKKLKIELG